MGFNDHMSDQEFSRQIREIVVEGDLEMGTPAYGIAQQVLHKGYGSLSKAQKHIYDTKVGPLLIRPTLDSPTSFQRTREKD